MKAQNIYGKTDSAMSATGFTLAKTGGNIQAWRRDITPDSHVLITCGKDSCDIYGDPDKAEWLVCRYFDDNPGCVAGEDCGPVTLAEAIAWADLQVSGNNA